MFGRSQGLRALRQCREGVGLLTERWYGDGVDGGKSILGSKPGSGKGMGWNGCRNGVKTGPTIIIYLICYCIGNPSLIGSLYLYPTCIQYPQSNAHRVGSGQYKSF